MLHYGVPGSRLVHHRAATSRSAVLGTRGPAKLYLNAVLQKGTPDVLLIQQRLTSPPPLRAPKNPC